MKGLPIRDETQFIVRPEANHDIEESFNWYEDQQKGLGHDFRFAVTQCLDLIDTRPHSFPDVYRGLRKAVLNLSLLKFFTR